MGSTLRIARSVVAKSPSGSVNARGSRLARVTLRPGGNPDSGIDSSTMTRQQTVTGGSDSTSQAVASYSEQRPSPLAEVVEPKDRQESQRCEPVLPAALASIRLPVALLLPDHLCLEGG
jgi:hypothetical protein